MTSSLCILELFWSSLSFIVIAIVTLSLCHFVTLSFCHLQLCWSSPIGHFCHPGISMVTAWSIMGTAIPEGWRWQQVYRANALWHSFLISVCAFSGLVAAVLYEHNKVMRILLQLRYWCHYRHLCFISSLRDSFWAVLESLNTPWGCLAVTAQLPAYILHSLMQLSTSPGRVWQCGEIPYAARLGHCAEEPAMERRAGAGLGLCSGQGSGGVRTILHGLTWCTNKWAPKIVQRVIFATADFFSDFIFSVWVCPLPCSLYYEFANPGLFMKMKIPRWLQTASKCRIRTLQ